MQQAGRHEPIESEPEGDDIGAEATLGEPGGTSGQPPHGHTEEAWELPVPEFETVFRGYERTAVDAHISELRQELERLQSRIDEHQSQLADATRTEQLRDLDDDDLMVVASQEVAELIRSAKSRGLKIVNQATRQSSQMVAEAEERRSAIEKAAEADRQRAREDAEETRATAQRERDELVAAAEQQLHDAQSQAEATRQEAEEQAEALRREAEQHAQATREAAEADAAATRAEADRRLEEAAEEADRRVADAAAQADQRVAEADATAARTIADAEQRAEQLVADAQARVDELGRVFEEHRARFLADLEAQRNASRTVFDELVEARHSFTNAYHAVSERVDQAMMQLTGPVERAQQFMDQATRALGEESSVEDAQADPSARSHAQRTVPQPEAASGGSSAADEDVAEPTEREAG